MNRKSGLFLVSILILSSFMVILPIQSTAAEPVRVYVNPPSIVDPPVFFNVSVNIENVVGLAGVQWQLTWDPTLLSAVNMTEVMFHQVTPQSEWDNIHCWWQDTDNVLGRARYLYDYSDIFRAEQGGYCPISGNYTMAIIGFQVKSVGNCVLNFTESILGDQNAIAIAHEEVDGFFSNSVPPPLFPPSSLESSQVLIYADPHRVKNETISVNSTFSVAVKLNSIANHTGIIGFSFGLFWNSTLLDFVNVTDVVLHDVTPESKWGSINARILSLTNGYFEYEAWFLNPHQAVVDGYAPIFGNHTIAIVTFRVKSEGECLLHLSNCRISEYPYASLLLYSAIDGFFGNTLNGDLNHDNVVNTLDAILLSKYFGATLNSPNWKEDADINGDGVVNILDAILLSHYFGHTR